MGRRRICPLLGYPIQRGFQRGRAGTTGAESVRGTHVPECAGNGRLDGFNEHSDLLTQRWKSHQGMLGYETVFGTNWHMSAVATLSENRYKGTDPIFQRHRKGQHRNLHVTVSNRAWSWNGYLPELTAGITETKSNIDLYDRDKFTFRLGLRKLF